MRGIEASGPGALYGLPSTLSTSVISSTPTPTVSPSFLSNTNPDTVSHNIQNVLRSMSSQFVADRPVNASGNSSGSTGKGILIGILSAFGSAAVAVIILALFFFFKYTQQGRILLDRIGRPGEYDDEQAFARDEEEALETMDDISRTDYLRAKGEFHVRGGQSDG